MSSDWQRLSSGLVPLPGHHVPVAPNQRQTFPGFVSARPLVALYSLKCLGIQSHGELVWAGFVKRDIFLGLREPSTRLDMLQILINNNMV